MELLDTYIKLAQWYSWQISLSGFAAFISQIKEGRRRADGSWQW